MPYIKKGYPQGERHYKARLSDEDVELIRQLRDCGLTYRQISEKFESNYWTIRDIAAYRNRRQLTKGYTPEAD